MIVGFQKFGLSECEVVEGAIEIYLKDRTSIFKVVLDFSYVHKLSTISVIADSTLLKPCF